MLAQLARHRFAARGLAIVLFFLIAFAIDQATGQRHSNILGSAAIAASVVVVWPWQRSILLDAVGYAGTWLAFALARAFASESSLPVIDAGSIGNLENSLFGGRPPSSYLQDAVYQSGTTQVHDLVSIAVHVSFFVVPGIVALLLCLTNRQRFRRYWMATAAMLLLATAGFLLMPTAPPWLHDADEVHRVVVELADGRGVALGTSDTVSAGGTQALSFDPNTLAAMPSVHVAAAVLVFLAAWRYRRSVRLLGLCYAVAMSVSVVYLGEHYLLDVLGGWVVAYSGWWWASRFDDSASVMRDTPATLPRTH